jgi:hemerythrin-like domain-containing protein
LEHSTCRNDLVGRLMEEHTLLVRKTHELNEYIQQWRHDSPVPRERVVSMIADYLHMQWGHLNLEESSVFDLLQQELTPGDWERVEASLPASTDPLFGNPMRQRFENIFERLIA